MMDAQISFHTAIRNDPVWVRFEDKWLAGALTGFSPKHARVLLEGRQPARLVKVLWDAVRRRDPKLPDNGDRPDITAAAAIEKALGPALGSLNAMRRGARRAGFKV